MPFIAGCIAIILWGMLALFTVYTGNIPALQLTAMTFFIATIIGLIQLTRGGKKEFNRLRQAISPGVVLFGVAGLFGYHFCYFLALKNAPAESASLIAYLWPLFIVLLSTKVLGNRLTIWHIAGALLGLGGCFLLVTKGQGLVLEKQYLFGYLVALACAFIWSSYSVFSRRFAAVPTSIVTIYCFFTALLSLIMHFVMETTVWPISALQWLGVAGLGLGPVGIAFFCWDYAMKNGPVNVLGVAAYFAPLISTIILGISGTAEITKVIWLGCLCIVFGALLSAKEFWWKK